MAVLRKPFLLIVGLFAATALGGTGSPSSAAQSAKPAVHPKTSIDEVVDAVSTCVTATGAEYVNLDTLAKGGWKITEVFGNPAELAINNYNRPGSNADIMIIKLAKNPGSYQCSAIGRFPNEASFAELDRRVETLLGRGPDDKSSATADDGSRTETFSWRLSHKAVTFAHFYGRSSVMITMRYVE